MKGFAHIFLLQLMKGYHMNNSTKNFIKKSLLVMFITKTFLFIDITFAANLTDHSEVKEVKEDTHATVNAGQDMKKPARTVQNDAHAIKKDTEHASRTIKEDFKTLAQDIKAEVKEKVGHAAGQIKEKLTDLKEGAQEKAHTAKEYIKIGTCVATETVKEKAHDLKSTGQENIKKAQKTVKHKADVAKENIKHGAQEAATKVSAAKDTVKDKLKDTAEHAKSSFEDTKEAIKEAKPTTFKYPTQKSNRDVKKNLKIVLKNVKKRKLALIEKLTEELINYEIELQKRVAQGLTKTELEKDPTLLKLKKAIETTEYELAFLEKKYNTLWAKTYPTLAKLTCGLQAKFTKEKK